MQVGDNIKRAGWARLGLEMALVMRERESLASQLVMWTNGTKTAEKSSCRLAPSNGLVM
jgi:hypothetical protein